MRKCCIEATRTESETGSSYTKHDHVCALSSSPRLAELRLEQFFQLVVQLAFCWSHPRHGHALFDAPRPNQTFVNQTTVLGKIDEATAVPVAVKKCFETCLPRMRGDEGEEYRRRLSADRDAQTLLKSYEIQLEEWARKLRTSLSATKSDPLEHWSRALDAKRCLGTVSVPVTDRSGKQVTYKASLSAAQARVCFLEAQVDTHNLALGKPKVQDMFDTPVIMEAIARCGEVKYGGVDAMDALAK